MMDLENKRVVVVGLKRTGAALARFLAKRCSRVIITDRADEKQLSAYIKKIRDFEIDLELGGHRDETFRSADLIVLSPGVPHTLPPIEKAKEAGALVIGEIELAYAFIDEPIVAVTGTNGKTTTTELIGEMLRHSGKKVFVGGNIGNPLIEYVDQVEKADVVVAEVSSFQLDTIRSFQPTVGVLLNITDDHLDRYNNFEAYAASKMKLFSNQGSMDHAVLNAADPVVAPFVKNIRSRILNFNAKDASEPGATIGNDVIGFHPDGTRNHVLGMTGVALRGRHNLENIAAAGLAAMACGSDPANIRAALKEFKGLPHRITYVKTVKGVRYFDDSKGTNVDAVKKAIESFDQPVVLIMGGRDKGGYFSLLEESLRLKVKHLVALGEAQNKILSAFKNVVKTSAATDMRDAVAQAAALAEAGDVVLLSPGCASFDMFESYVKRGEAFQQAVFEMGA